MKDHLGRPLVAVTGIGLVSPLGWGLDKNWAALLAGTSGITRIRRFATDHLKTTMAGTVDLPEELAGAEPVSAPVRVERMAAAAIAEALVAADMVGHSAQAQVHAHPVPGRQVAGRGVHQAAVEQDH